MPLVSEDSEEAAAFDNEFRWFRGGSVAAFAQIEFAIFRLLFCLKERPDLVSAFAAPFKAESRASALRTVFSQNNQLRAFASDAEMIAGNFETLIPIRNFLAHGFARLDVAANTVTIWKGGTKGDPWASQTWELPRSEIPTRGRQIEQFVEIVWDFVQRVDKEFRLGF